MATLWERLAGDTDVFALKIAFAPDPDQGQAIYPELALSWGSFQIWVGGRNLCAHLEEGEHITSVHWYILPLIEWFAHHWDSLLHEERLPVKNDGVSAWESLRATQFPPPVIEDDWKQASKWESEWQAWWTRHCLRAAREGGLFPDIVFRRLRDMVEVSWGPVHTSNALHGFEFAEASQGGAVKLPPQAVAEPLHEVLSDASDYLLTLAPHSRRIQTLREKHRAVGKPGRNQENRLMWLAGLGANEHMVRTRWRRAVASLSALAEAPRRAMLEAKESPLVVTGSCQAAMMFGSLAPNIGEQDVLSLAQMMVDLYRTKEARKEGSKRRTGIVPVEETDYGDGFILGRVGSFERVRNNRASHELFGNGPNDEMKREFFVKLAEAGELTVSALKQFLADNSNEKDRAILKRRLNWFSQGRYNKDGWHLTVEMVGKGGSGSDKVRFHPIGTSDMLWSVGRAASVEESTSPAWSQGYELAAALHEEFDEHFMTETSVDVKTLVERLGIEVKELKLTDKNVRGVSIAGPQHRPGIAVNLNYAANKYDSGRRFTLGHELCHLLYDQETGSRLALASGPWAPRGVERRANAFAAMLLMPSSLVQQALSNMTQPLATWKGVSELAHSLRVGHSSMLSHLKNLGYIDESDEQRIADELHPSAGGSDGNC